MHGLGDRRPIAFVELSPDEYRASLAARVEADADARLFDSVALGRTSTVS